MFNLQCWHLNGYRIHWPDLHAVPYSSDIRPVFLREERKHYLWLIERRRRGDEGDGVRARQLWRCINTARLQAKWKTGWRYTGTLPFRATTPACDLRYSDLLRPPTLTGIPVTGGIVKPYWNAGITSHYYPETLFSDILFLLLQYDAVHLCHCDYSKLEAVCQSFVLDICCCWWPTDAIVIYRFIPVMMFSVFVVVLLVTLFCSCSYIRRLFGKFCYSDCSIVLEYMMEIYDTLMTITIDRCCSRYDAWLFCCCVMPTFVVTILWCHSTVHSCTIRYLPIYILLLFWWWVPMEWFVTFVLMNFILFVHLLLILTIDCDVSDTPFSTRYSDLLR